MHITAQGQITIPPEIRNALGLQLTEEVEFIQDENGRWYLTKVQSQKASRFRTAHRAGTMRMTTEEIMALTRHD